MSWKACTENASLLNPFPDGRGWGEGAFQFSRWAEAAMSEMYPLWLLRNLPNMVACHIAIAHDARGPNNTIGHSDVSSLNAIIEAVRVIQRDAADVMIVGGVGARVNPTSQAYRGDMDLVASQRRSGTRLPAIRRRSRRLGERRRGRRIHFGKPPTRRKTRRANSGPYSEIFQRPRAAASRSAACRLSDSPRADRLAIPRRPASPLTSATSTPTA